MSRCFPFPPPGYEKKPRPDDGNLLIKEKHREKKHKKEKKDKDKKERKEKKDKEQSGEKRREKKEKKNKHKDKKDKERDKEKQRISEEKKVLGTSEHQNGRKPSPTGMQCNDSQPMFLLELEKRLRNKDGATESKMVGKIVAADEGCFRFQGKVTERNFDILSDAKEKFKDKRDDHRMVSGQTLKVVARALENGVGPHVMGEDEKKVEGGFYQVEKVNEKEKERREKKKHKDGDGKRDKHQDRDQNKQNKSKDRKGEKGKEKEEKAIEKRCKLQIKQSSIDTVDIHGNGPLYLSNESRSKGNLGKRKDPETNGVLWDDDSRSDKLPRPVSSSHQVMQNGSKCDSSQTAVQFAQERQDIVQDHKVNAKVSFHQSVLQNGKKMDPAHIVNGFMSEQKITFNNHKVQNGILHSQRVGGTGKNPESCQAAMNLTNLGPGIVGNHNVNNNVSSLQPDVANQTRSNGSQAIIYTTAERQGIFSPHKVDGKKSMINGVIKTEESKKIKEKSKTHKRPPHPDSKYLSQILTVPEVEWSDFDDQEWLFSSSDSKTKKPRTVSTKIEEAKLVWAEALPMESSDVVALPYVIPY